MRRRGIGCLPMIMLACIMIVMTIGRIYLQEGYLNEKVKETVVTEKEKKDVKKGDGYEIDWKKLPKDCVAWIRFKHPSVIQYPVMKAKDNDYYLHRNLKGEYSFSGSVFMDYHNDKEMKDENTIIYGHNMANGTMFGSLKKYREKSYWKKHPYFYIYTRKGYRYKYKIYNVALVDPYSQIYVYEFGSDDLKEKYIHTWKKNGLYDTGVLPSYERKIVTLSTCQYHGTRRLVVQGVLTETLQME